MIIEVRQGESGKREWVMLELQGVLETPRSKVAAGLKIGDLELNAQGKVELIIGNHRLVGKVVELSNPLAVFRKQGSGSQRVSVAASSHSTDSGYGEASGAGSGSEDGAGGGDDTVGAGTEPTWYEVAGFVHKKVVFKERPRPIVRAAKTARTALGLRSCTA